MASLLRILWVTRLVSSLIVFASRSPPFITSSPVCCRSHTTWRTDQWHSAVTSSSFPLTSCENTSLVHSLIPIPFQPHSNPFSTHFQSIPVSFQYHSSLIPRPFYCLFFSKLQLPVSRVSTMWANQKEGFQVLQFDCMSQFLLLQPKVTRTWKSTVASFHPTLLPRPLWPQFQSILASFPGAFIIDQ